MSVLKQLNQIQADAHALYIAFHAYHWNIKGMSFYQIHKATEKAYDEMGELFDEMAERALMLGGKAISNIDELNSLAKAPISIKEKYSDKEVLQNCLNAYEYLVEAFKKLESKAEKDGDQTTIALAQEKYAKLEKEIWMLKNALA